MFEVQPQRAPSVLDLLFFPFDGAKIERLFRLAMAVFSIVQKPVQLLVTCPKNCPTFGVLSENKH